MLYKQLMSLLFFSCSLVAMQNSSYPMDHMKVFVGGGRPLLSLKQVMQFPELATRLMKAGYKSQDDGNTWVYGIDDTVFSQKERDALWAMSSGQKGDCPSVVVSQQLGY